MLGPRQCGKTTLARQIEADRYFDLENPRHLAQLNEPQLTLEGLRGTIVIDEVQRRPDLFPLLRYLADQQHRQKFLLLGSASRNLLKQSSETLAGRIAYFVLRGFSLQEIGADQIRRLWVRGGFPRSYLTANEEESQLWRENYISTFLERDIPQLGIQIPAATLRRFWMMLSHYHGQLLNYSELARSFGISDMTARHYVDILVGTFMVRLLPPWHVNLGKRLVKSPKLYFRDSGLFHSLQSIENERQLLAHPKLGASWEGFALEQVTTILGIDERSQFFWATHNGAELDLFWQEKGKNWGIEFKYTDAPKRAKSMLNTLQDLKLSHLWVVYPGSEKYRLDRQITALPLSHISRKLLP